MDVDYRLAFDDHGSVGMILSRNRAMVDCNRHVCEMFGFSRECCSVSRSRCSTQPEEYERLGAHMAPILNTRACTPTAAS